MAGRIDFYISSKKWGIEIIWDGKKVGILFSCRGTKSPLVKILTTSLLLKIPNLFHAVIDRARHSNRCEEMVTRALLENH
jgi:hypothetical protein